MDERVKDTRGKAPMHLILWKAARWFVRIRVYGLKKYPDANNWKQVPTICWYDACLRHLAAYGSGELIDKESGQPHLAHAFTNLWYLIEATLEEPNFEEDKDNGQSRKSGSSGFWSRIKGYAKSKKQLGESR